MVPVNFKYWVDPRGLIVHRRINPPHLADPVDPSDPKNRRINGGDSFGRCGLMGCFDRENGWKYLIAAYSRCHVGEGLFCRHPLRIPGFNFWYDPAKLSRDNQIMMICGSGYFIHVNQIRNSLQVMYEAQVIRGLKMQNADIAGPWVWSAYYRSLGINKSTFWGDLHLVFESILRVLDFSKNGVGKSMTHLPIVLHAVDFKPTLLSRFAKWFFRKFRNVKKDYEIYYNPEVGAPPFHIVGEEYFK